MQSFDKQIPDEIIEAKAFIKRLKSFDAGECNNCGGGECHNDGNCPAFSEEEFNRIKLGLMAVINNGNQKFSWKAGKLSNVIADKIKRLGIDW